VSSGSSQTDISDLASQDWQDSTPEQGRKIARCGSFNVPVSCRPNSMRAFTAMTSSGTLPHDPVHLDGPDLRRRRCLARGVESGVDITNAGPSMQNFPHRDCRSHRTRRGSRRYDDARRDRDGGRGADRRRAGGCRRAAALGKRSVRRSESDPLEGLIGGCRSAELRGPWRMLKVDKVYVVRHKVLVEGRSQRHRALDNFSFASNLLRFCSADS